MTIFVTHDGGQTVRGVPDHFEVTIMNRVNSSRDGLRRASRREVGRCVPLSPVPMRWPGQAGDPCVRCGQMVL